MPANTNSSIEKQGCTVGTYEPERFGRYCASVHAHPTEHGVLVDNRDGLAILAGLQSALLGGGSRPCNAQQGCNIKLENIIRTVQDRISVGDVALQEVCLLQPFEIIDVSGLFFVHSAIS